MKRNNILIIFFSSIFKDILIQNEVQEISIYMSVTFSVLKCILIDISISNCQWNRIIIKKKGPMNINETVLY